MTVSLGVECDRPPLGGASRLFPLGSSLPGQGLWGWAASRLLLLQAGPCPGLVLGFRAPHLALPLGWGWAKPPGPKEGAPAQGSAAVDSFGVPWWQDSSLLANEGLHQRQQRSGLRQPTLLLFHDLSCCPVLVPGSPLPVHSGPTRFPFSGVRSARQSEASLPVPHSAPTHGVIASWRPKRTHGPRPGSIAAGRHTCDGLLTGLCFLSLLSHLISHAERQ